MSKLTKTKYGLIVFGRSKALYFENRKERDRIRKYLQGLVTMTTFTER